MTKPGRRQRAEVELTEWHASCFTPYDEKLVDAIREQVPCKRWDRGARCWRVPLWCVPGLLEVLHEHCNEVYVAWLGVGDVPPTEEWAHLAATMVDILARHAAGLAAGRR